MSLRDGTVKMSKSDASELSRIHLDDSPDEVLKKIRKAKTDSEASVSYNKVIRPEVSNLIEILSELREESIAALVQVSFLSMYVLSCRLEV